MYFPSPEAFDDYKSHIELGDKPYSEDGKTIKYATGLWEKGKVMASQLKQENAKNLDSAILLLFEEELRPLILKNAGRTTEESNPLEKYPSLIKHRENDTQMVQLSPRDSALLARSNAIMRAAIDTCNNFARTFGKLENVTINPPDNWRGSYIGQTKDGQPDGSGVLYLDPGQTIPYEDREFEMTKVEGNFGRLHQAGVGFCIRTIEAKSKIYTKEGLVFEQEAQSLYKSLEFGKLTLISSTRFATTKNARNNASI